MKFKLTIMKRVLSMMTVMMMIVSSFTSCTTADQDEAMTLTGIWEGDLGVAMYSDYYGTSYDCYDTTIQFNSNGWGATSGTGYELDRFSNAPWNYLYNPIYWTVSNGTIVISYPMQNNYTVTITDYYLTDNYFSGYMSDGTKFSLHHLASFDWSPYYNYTYDKTRSSNSIDMSKFHFVNKHNVVNK
jgi:hypothetical protein